MKSPCRLFISPCRLFISPCRFSQQPRHIAFSAVYGRLFSSLCRLFIRQCCIFCQCLSQFNLKHFTELVQRDALQPGPKHVWLYTFFFLAAKQFSWLKWWNILIYYSTRLQFGQRYVTDSVAIAVGLFIYIIYIIHNT